MDRFTRRIYRNKVIILVYHGFTDKKYHEGIENYQGKHLNIDIFKSHIEHLKKFYNIIPLAHLVESCAGIRTLVPNSAVITIDDGYQSNYLLAYPVLKRFDAPATVFLSTDFVNRKEPLWVDRIEYAIDKTANKRFRLRIGKEILSFGLGNTVLKRMCDRTLRSRLKSITGQKREKLIKDLEYNLSQKLIMGSDTPEIYRSLEWYQVLDMSKSGLVSIGSHTCSHTALAHCIDEDAKRELSLSKQIIEEKTGLGCGFFCYPNGGIEDFNARTRNLLKGAGYLCGLTNTTGLNDKYSDVFELKRFGMSRSCGLGEFKRILAGVSRLPGYVKQKAQFLRSSLRGALEIENVKGDEAISRRAND